MINNSLTNAGIALYFQNYTDQPDEILSQNLDKNVTSLVEQITSMKETLSEADYKSYQFKTCQQQPVTADVAFGLMPRDDAITMLTAYNNASRLASEHNIDHDEFHRRRGGIPAKVSAQPV
jgi:hypothetical protein